MNHTPTPWHLHKVSERDYNIGDSNDSCIATAYWNEANAEFIVKACNSHDALLEALKAFEHAFDSGLDIKAEFVGSMLLGDAIEKAKAAIIKATQ